jgi:DMSO/TMAO reductase YedYZ molybdopterin-dependent catalytic subunit
MNADTLTTRTLAALPTAAVGLFAGIAAVAGSYAAAGLTPSFVAAPVAGFLSRQLPDVVIRYAITVLGSLGQQLNLLSAVALVATAVGVLAASGLVLGRQLNNRAVPAVLTGVGTWALSVLLTGSVLLSLGAAGGAVTVVALAVVVRTVEFGSESRTVDGRREVVGAGLSVLGIGATSYVLGQQRTPGKGAVGSSPALGDSGANGTNASRRQALLQQGREQSFDLDGMDGLVTEVEGGDFYQVDINAVDPTVDESEWSLSVTGAVETEVSVGYEELRSMPATDRFETLRCVGEQLNGHKMDTALWTGTPIMDLVERAGPQSGCECVMLRAEDDYFEEFPMAALEDALLAYGMNGNQLPRAHGYPVRALVPGHWGEISVKWIDEIEILEREADGYWEQRGWHGTGPVNTVAKIHHDSQQDGRVTVGGHAYAGTRGIQQVEVSTDGGSTWNEAELTPQLDGITAERSSASERAEPVGDVWRQWRYEYDHPGSSHEVVARATDGNGRLQSREESDPFPSGPSGWVSKTIN